MKWLFSRPETQIKQVLGESMPRAGHHLVHRILAAQFGSAFGYCSFYSRWKHDSFETCCKSFPCKRARHAQYSVFLQKSHDHHHRDPVIRKARYLVQIRAPIPRLFSNFSLFIRGKPDKDCEAEFHRFAIREAEYYARFWQK